MNHSDHQKDINKKVALFYFAYRSLIERPDQIAEKYHIQRMHHRILFFIGNLPGVSVNELLNILEVTKQALNAPLRQLKEKSYITTVSDEQDKRIKRLFLTENGSEVLDELTQAQTEQLEAIFSQFSCETIKNWVEVMEQFAKERPGSHYLDSFG